MGIEIAEKFCEMAALRLLRQVLELGEASEADEKYRWACRGCEHQGTAVWDEPRTRIFVRLKALEASTRPSETRAKVEDFYQR